MHFRHEIFISIICIFVITVQIAQCDVPHDTVKTQKKTSTKTKSVKSQNKNNANKFQNISQPPPGFRYVYLKDMDAEIQKGSYTLMSYDEAMDTFNNQLNPPPKGFHYVNFKDVEEDYKRGKYKLVPYEEAVRSINVKHEPSQAKTKSKSHGQTAGKTHPRNLHNSDADKVVGDKVVGDKGVCDKEVCDKEVCDDKVDGSHGGASNGKGGDSAHDGSGDDDERNSNGRQVAETNGEKNERSKEVVESGNGEGVVKSGHGGGGGDKEVQEEDGHGNHAADVKGYAFDDGKLEAMEGMVMKGEAAEKGASNSKGGDSHGKGGSSQGDDDKTNSNGHQVVEFHGEKNERSKEVVESGYSEEVLKSGQGHGEGVGDEEVQDDDDHRNYAADDKNYSGVDALDGGVLEAMEERAMKEESAEKAMKGKGKGGGSGEVPSDKSRRKKRSFSLKLPFMSSDEAAATGTDAAATAAAAGTDTVVTTAEAVTATTVTDSADGGTNTTTVTATTVATETTGADSSGGASDVKVTTVQTSVITDGDAGFMDRFNSRMTTMMSYGNNVKTSLAMATPYLPIVWKVATFVSPGLSQYELLVLTMHVATVTGQALMNANSDESWSTTLTNVAKKAFWESMMSKRDAGFNLGDYTSNVYESIKTHFGNIPKYFSGDETTNSMTVEREVTTINNEIPKTELIVTENESIIESQNMSKELKKIMNMRKRVSFSSEGSVSRSDINDADDKIDIIAENEEVEPLFEQILNRSMKLQPESIQEMSGEELVDFLDNLSVQSVVDTKSIFEDIVSKMDLNDRVTDEQRSRLIDMLSKITDYFIAKGLQAKELLNSITH